MPRDTATDLRQRIDSLTYTDEEAHIARLKEAAALSEADRAAISDKGADLVRKIRNDAKPGLMEVFLKMVDLIMQAAPFFVFALLAGTVSKMAGDDVSKVLEIFKGLSWYSLTVFIGLALMVSLVYPLIMKFLVKSVSYTGFFKAMSPAQTLAFSTSSSYK